jgi:hypothetical protein
VTRLKFRRECLYNYSSPVRFGPWRLLVKPIDPQANRLVDAILETPPLTTDGPMTPMTPMATAFAS